MKSRFLSLLLATATLYGEAGYKNVEVYTKEIARSGNDTVINSGVIVNYDGKILVANRASYSAKDKILTLEDNVTMMDDLSRKLHADKVTINLENNHLKFKNFFEIDKDYIWIASLKAEKKDDIILLNGAMFSSCDIEKNPDWSINFKEAKYDLKKKELELKDAVVRVKSLPVFYTPYFYVPLAKERKTGFLLPYFSLDKNDGFSYTQPFFWAINESSDLEIVTNIRTSRGFGTYFTYRIANNEDSLAKIRVGYFKDSSSFTKEHTLKYDKHYGVELYYKDHSLIDALSKKGFENKLYINGVYFNNKDYIELQSYDKLSHHELGQFYESRLNYYIKSNNFYSGLYFKYFIDTTKDSNKDTLQIAPKLHFHIPLKHLYKNNLSYSFDGSLTNYTRDSGTKAFKVKSTLPLNLHFSLFGGYLNLNMTSELDVTAYDFYNVPMEQKKYSSIVLNNQIELSTELVKRYKEWTHTSLFSATYTKSNILSEKWMRYEDIPEDLKINFIDDIPFESKITLRTHQFWQKKDFKIRYILESHYFPDEKKFRDLDQEIDLTYKNFSFYSKFGYSFLYKKTTDVYNKISYKTPKYGVSLGYLWKKDPLSFETLTREISLDGYYNYKPNMKFKGEVAYNIKDKHLKKWEAGVFYKKRCWSVNFAVGQNITPTIRSDGTRGSIKNNYVKVYLNILPFGIGGGN